MMSDHGGTTEGGGEGWSATLMEGADERTISGGEIKITAAGLVHRQDGRVRMYPWHRVLHVDWSESKTAARSAVAQAAGLSIDEDPYHVHDE
jgi:hypothetical protein